MWPKLSNIDTTIESTIKRYANDNLAASKLNAWVRVYSGVNDGLILESNTNFKIFSAAGEGGNSIYGNSQLSGTIGRKFGSGTVSTDAGRVLRPSPIITSLNSKEGQDQISRTCEFSITCFSLQQLETIQNYFMEPGYSVGVEWGWNTEASSLGLVATSGNIVNQIADTTLNNTALNSKRILTNGEYDIFLGFIVGSTVSSDGENFKVDVKLRGSPSLPTYFQSQNKITETANGVKVDEAKAEDLYLESELTKEGIKNSRDRRFKFMFNELPAQRQTKNVKNLLTKTVYQDFINFDKLDRKKIDEFLAAGFLGSETIDIELDGAVVEIEKEKLFSKNKYIRFGLAVDILNEIGAANKFPIGNKNVSFKININNCIIGSFPRMFSTKASKLIVPGYQPWFIRAYFLNGKSIIQENTGILRQTDGAFSTTKIPNFPVFHEPEALDAKELGLKEQAGGYWGYLKNLYVNFDLFKEKIEQKNKNIREVVLDILNEMSSAVNSFWNFQVVEGEDADGNIEITVIDENWIGQNPNDGVATEFKHSGVGSPFLNATLDISIPGEMAGKIINNRLGNDSQTDLNPIKMGFIFEEKTDLFLEKVREAGAGTDFSGTSGAAGTSGEVTDAAGSDLEKKKARLAEIKGKLDTTISGPGTPDETTGNIIYKKADGEWVYTTDAAGNLIFVNQYAGPNDPVSSAEKQELNTLIKEVKAQSIELATAAVNANLEKLDVVVRPTTTLDEIDAKKLVDDDFVGTAFFAYCFDDTDFLEKIRNYYMNIKYGGLSQPLPIKYSFTILGNSGIRRGDVFKIQGIPPKYAERGIFQVTGIEHSISGMKWETTVESIYRQTE